MKTIQEQNVFQFSSLFVAACLIFIGVFIDEVDFNLETSQILFLISSSVFLMFIYWFNNKIKNLNGFLSSYATTFLSYTFLVVLHTLVYMVYDHSLSFISYFGIVGVFLAYGYVLNLGISLVVYLLYKVLLFFKTI